MLNVIFDKKDQSNEKYYLDYCNSLIMAGCEAICLTYNEDKIVDLLPKEAKVITLKNFGQWDPIASWKIKGIFETVRPDVTIVHGARALNIFRKIHLPQPTIGVCHTSNIQHLWGYEHILVNNKSLKKLFIKNGYNEDSIHIIPDVISTDLEEKKLTFKWKNKPPVIGSFGKFTGRKGFKTLLTSFSILQGRSVPFQAILSGKGQDYEKLRSQSSNLLIDNLLFFENWIEDKKKFFQSIDIFCLPSLESYSSLSLLEAFSYGLPVVATMTEGNIEVANTERNCILVPAGEADPIAYAVERLLRDTNLAEKIAKNAYATVKNDYSQDNHVKVLMSTLESIINQEYYL